VHTLHTTSTIRATCQESSTSRSNFYLGGGIVLACSGSARSFTCFLLEFTQPESGLDAHGEQACFCMSSLSRLLMLLSFPFLNDRGNCWLFPFYLDDAELSSTRVLLAIVSFAHDTLLLTAVRLPSMLGPNTLGSIIAPSMSPSSPHAWIASCWGREGHSAASLHHTQIFSYNYQMFCCFSSHFLRMKQ
jgi:hypothetical protein